MSIFLIHKVTITLVKMLTLIEITLPGFRDDYDIDILCTYEFCYSPSNERLCAQIL